jgi:hypothetical protein
MVASRLQQRCCYSCMTSSIAALLLHLPGFSTAALPEP